MGWKSTRKISREEATDAILRVLASASNKELEDIMEFIFGDNPDRPYWGNNFYVTYSESDNEV